MMLIRINIQASSFKEVDSILINLEFWEPNQVSLSLGLLISSIADISIALV